MAGKAKQTKEDIPINETKHEESKGFIPEGVLPQDTLVHLMKSGTEFLMAMDGLMPRNKVPVEVKEHYRNAKKETLLMFKAFIDSQINEMETKEKAPAPRLRKIDLD